MNVKEPTSLLAKSREIETHFTSRYPGEVHGQTLQTGSFTRVVRPAGHIY